MAYSYSCSCLFNNVNLNVRYIIMYFNSHHYETLNPDAYWDRKFSHLTPDEIKLKITEIEKKGEDVTVREVTILEYLKRK